MPETANDVYLSNQLINTMKKVVRLIAFLMLPAFIAVTTVACGEEKKEEEEKKEDNNPPADDEEANNQEKQEEMEEAETPAEWPERDAFHEYMANTWHPADEGDFAPLKEMARDMAASADAWATADIPEEYNKDGVAETLSKLSEEANALADKVEEGSASDDELLTEIANLHDTFHTIVEKCHGGEGHHHHHGDGEGHKHGEGEHKCGEGQCGEGKCGEGHDH